MSKITNPTTESSVTCGFFNSIVTTNSDGTKTSDRLYNAEQMSAIFDGLINDGVFASIGDKLVVKASSGNVVNVGTGKCWFNHTWTRNDAILPIDCGDPPTNLKRIDAVVVEVNASPDKRDNFIKVIPGKEASTPDKPKMTKSTLINQHALCYITRKPGMSITQADIENAVGTSETPFVTGIVQVTSLDELLGQWTDQLNQYMASGSKKIDDYIDSEEADFDKWYAQMKLDIAEALATTNTWTTTEQQTIMNWFNEIKGQLSEDPALNLQIQIDANEVERLLMEGLPDGTKTFSEDGTVIKTVDSKGRELVKTFTDNWLTITSVLTDREIKDYLPYPYAAFNGEKTVTKNGVVFTDNGDGTITANGTASFESYLKITESEFTLTPDTYSLSGCPIGASVETYYLVSNLYKDGNQYVPGSEVTEIGYGATLDLTDKTYTKVEILIGIKTGVTLNNVIFNPKVKTSGSELGRLVKKISADGKTIKTTLTNNADAVPNLVEIERAVDTIIASENSYIGGDGV